MNTYKIIVRSHERTIVLVLLLLIIYFLIAGLVFPIVTRFERFFLTIIVVLIAHFSIRRLATAKTEWTLSDDDISIKWLTNYFGVKDSDIDINWTDVDKYKDVYGRGYNLFKIYLLNGNTIRFGHGGLFLTDDFNQFYEQFQEMYLKKKYPDQWTKYYKKKLS